MITDKTSVHISKEGEQVTLKITWHINRKEQSEEQKLVTQNIVTKFFELLSEKYSNIEFKIPENYSNIKEFIVPLVFTTKDSLESILEYILNNQNNENRRDA